MSHSCLVRESFTTWNGATPSCGSRPCSGPTNRFFRRFATLHMRLLSSLGGIWLLALAALASNAGVSVIGFFLLVFGAIAFGVAWLVHVLRIFGRRTADSAAPSKWIWVMGPAYIATAVALGFTGGPRGPLFRARFSLSERALTREAQRLLQSPPPVRDRAGARRAVLRATRRCGRGTGQVHHHVVRHDRLVRAGVRTDDRAQTLAGGRLLAARRSLVAPLRRVLSEGQRAQPRTEFRAVSRLAVRA